MNKMKLRSKKTLLEIFLVSLVVVVVDRIHDRRVSRESAYRLHRVQKTRTTRFSPTKLKALFETLVMEMGGSLRACQYSHHIALKI
jgi:hypothetical protein